MNEDAGEPRNVDQPGKVSAAPGVTAPPGETGGLDVERHPVTAGRYGGVSGDLDLPDRPVAHFLAQSAVAAFQDVAEPPPFQVEVAYRLSGLPVFPVDVDSHGILFCRFRRQVK